MGQLRVGINGFGRIGRILFRAAMKNKNPEGMFYHPLQLIIPPRRRP